MVFCAGKPVCCEWVAPPVLGAAVPALAQAVAALSTPAHTAPARRHGLRRRPLLGHGVLQLENTDSRVVNFTTHMRLFRLSQK